MPGSNSSLSTWEAHLSELNDEIQAMAGVGNVNVSGFNVDEASAYKILMEQKAHAERMIARLGSGDASTSNARFTEAEGSY